MKINQSQSEAIRHRTGPAMVLAGPGSGKTTVITHRVKQLILEDHIDPASILVITFSRAAARQMQERFLLLVNRQHYPVTFGTFHAIFFHILKTSYGFHPRQVIGAEAQARFVREYIRRLRIEEDETDLVRDLLREISFVKTMGIDPGIYNPSSCGRDIFFMIFEAYAEYLKQNRYIDFDDMLLLTKQLLRERKDILRGWQKIFQHVLVDEFQDINPIQYEIIRMLAQPQDNLFIVGDDDQSIYRFRGAEPEIMLNFKRDYPSARTLQLNTNYRSSPRIVETAGNLISHNKKRFEKEVHAAVSGGLSPTTLFFETQRAQNQYLIETIRQINRESGVPFDEMAVLFRTNSQPELLIRQMCENNLPFLSKGHIPNLYDHWIAADLNAYLNLSAGKRSRSLFLKIMNRPDRNLSRQSLPYEEVSFEAWRDFYRHQPETVDQLKKLERDLAAIARMSPFPAINYIRKATGYEKYVIESAKNRHMKESEQKAVLDEIQEDAKPFLNFEEWFDYQDKIKEESANKYAEKSASGSAVVLSTMHAAKGLEFDTVFMIDVNEKIIPDKKAVTPDDLEEERRLFYVGITRAKRRLYLLCSSQIRNKTMAPSRFLKECEKRWEP